MAQLMLVQVRNQKTDKTTLSSTLACHVSHLMSRARSVLIPSASVVFLRVSYFCGITELNDSMCFRTDSHWSSALPMRNASK